MRKHFQILVAVSILLSISSSCASRSAFSPTECNEAAAYDRGYREGKSGLNPETEYSFQCREDLRENVRKGYRSGHDKGYAEYKVMLAEWQANQKKTASAATPTSSQPTPEPPYYCEITRDNRGFQAEGPTLDEARKKVVRQCSASFSYAICNVLPHCQKGTVATSPRAFYCKMKVFLKNYDAFGPTELETRATLKTKCAQDQGSDFHCSENKMQCQRNK